MQKDIFLHSEADSWFSRNLLNGNDTPSKDVRLYEKYIALRRGDVLEIGCANGKNLHYLGIKYPMNTYYGIDPSMKAIEEGQLLFTDIELSVGSADVLPYENKKFDVLIFGFCLYLVDVDLLAKVVSEADRVLNDKGFLIITDFSGKIPRKRRYRHYEGMFSYKYDYSKIFEAFPSYEIVEKMSYDHTEGYHFAKELSERIATTILYKDIENGYYFEED